MDENKVKTLYTLGGSYMSVDYPPGQVTSFLDLYATAQQLRHVSLARVGATNFMVRLQIDEAIKQKADYVILSTVPADRVDLVKETKMDRLMFELRSIGYRGYNCASEHNIDLDPSPTVISESLDDIVRNPTLSTDQKTALKIWAIELHNASLQRQKDYYMISDGIRRLQDHNIPFLLIPDLMEDMDWSWVNNVWPNNRPAPISMPNGICDQTVTVTHNNQLSHNMFAETLLETVPDWK